MTRFDEFIQDYKIQLDNKEIKNKIVKIFSILHGRWNEVKLGDFENDFENWKLYDRSLINDIAPLLPFHATFVENPLPGNFRLYICPDSEKYIKERFSFYILLSFITDNNEEKLEINFVHQSIKNGVGTVVVS